MIKKFLFATTFISIATIISIAGYSYFTKQQPALAAGNIINAASCEQTVVQAAIDTAIDGDTVLVPAGSCVWSSSIIINKAIIIRGFGTTLTASGILPQGFFYLYNFTSSNLVRITNFTFQMNDHTTSHAIYYGHTLNLSKLRIDHNTFYYGSVPIEIGGSKGVIDHNYFYNGIKAIQFTAGTRAQADESWVSMDAGTGDALFIEDNHFINNASYPGIYSQEKIGAHNGGKLIVRYNEFDADEWPLSVTAEFLMTHGSASGGCGVKGYWQANSCSRRGQSVVEIYNNVIHGKRIDFLVALRGSANLVYNNSITSQIYTPRIRLREEEYYESSNWAPLRVIWPAEDQAHNSFFWQNISNGVQMNSDPSKYFAVEANLNKDRDYFLHAPCDSSDITDVYGNLCTHGKEIFTGANGASSSYPTDGNTYPTNGTMVFTEAVANAYYPYTPYIYPHPLTIEASPPLKGDFNSDKKVNDLDFTDFKNAFKSIFNSLFDLNSDSIIDVKDLGVLMSGWLE